MQTKTKSKIKARLFPSVKILVFASLLSALSIVFGKFLAIPVGTVLRFSFENLPILISGIAFGPVIGMLTGVVADLIGCVLVGYEINPIVTIGAGAIGILSGGVYRLLKNVKPFLKMIISVITAHLVGSVIVKTIGLASFYSFPLFVLMGYRFLNYLVVGMLEVALIYYLLKNASIREIFGMNMKNKITCEKTDIEKALEYIHSVNWAFCKPGLERIGELCKKLNDPQNNLKFIHVAGTNGKGSFCSMLSSVLREQGYKVGLYTSPYIKCFNERMQINGEVISNKELVELTEKIKPIAESMQDKPTEFELVTAIAFEYFNKHKCDYVVLECGLGGRLDSTNIISTPILTVITGIALDHTSFLGDTVEKIAYEKAGIIKEGIPCLWCGEDKGAHEVIFQKAKEKNAPLYTVDRSTLNIKNATLDGTLFDFDGFNDVSIKLLGEYQTVNAANVLSAVKILRNTEVAVSEQSIYRGLEKARWSARFEIINKEPQIIFDGGHNPQGVDACINSVKHYFGNEKLYVVTGVMADKDHSYIAERIGQVAKEVFCITPNNPRALKADEYANEFSSFGVAARGYKTVQDALIAVLEKARADKCSVLCLGSLYMYCEILDELAKIS